MTERVDRNSFIPYYIQVKENIQERINRNEWKVGEQLPGEPQLCEMFDVSRTVIRQALNELTHDGLIVREKGKGTFVAEPNLRKNLVQKLTGFYDEMAGSCRVTMTQVLQQDKIPASPRVARYLGIAPGDPVIRLKRLRFVQDEPLVLVFSYLPYKLCAQLLNTDLAGNKSLYAYLERELGLRIVRGVRTIEAVAATAEEARLLETEEKAPLMLLDSISYLADGSAIEYYHALHRGDQSRLEVELVRDS